MDNELYVKRQKDKLKKAIESGMLNPEQQMAAIDDTIDKLLLVENGIDHEAVKKFETTINGYIESINSYQVKISDLYKKTYDKLLEL